uniref:Uncharacterized protein n=1 Tax=Opuntia streptacantha TaxID=393608 RepID=A0A7C9E2M3_OPUST
MEGLIPLVCKAIKRSNTKRQYRCLSKGNAQTYNIADFYGYDVDNHDGDDDDHDRVGKFYSPQIETRGAFDARRDGHRRSMSTGYKINGGYNLNYEHEGHGGGIHGGLSTPPPPPPNMQLKRFSSHRMFSCVTGAT